MTDNTESTEWREAACRQAEHLKQQLWYALHLDRETATSDERIAISHIAWELGTDDIDALTTLIGRALHRNVTSDRLPALPTIEELNQEHVEYGCIECLSCEAISNWVRLQPEPDKDVHDFDRVHFDKTGHNLYYLYRFIRNDSQIISFPQADKQGGDQ